MKLTQAKAQAFLAKPPRDLRAALFFGPNRALVADAARELADHALGGATDPFATTKLTDEDLRKDKARLMDALCAQSLLGGPTLVWLRLENESAADSVIHALGEIESGAPAGFLLIEGGELSASGKMAKAFDAAKTAALIAFYEEGPSERAAFARDLLRVQNISASTEALEALLSSAPDRAVLRAEIEKLAAYAHGLERPLNADDVEALVADQSESDVDAAALAALAGNAGEAVERLARTDGLSGIMALRALGRRLLRLLEARAAVDRGANPSEAAAQLRPPVFWKERDIFQAQLRAWSTRRLLSALDTLWAAELRAKQAQSPQELIAAEAYRRVAMAARGG